MRAFLHHVAIGLFHLGGPGLLLLSALDSSFLTMPLGNDLLVVALSASHHLRTPFYVFLATVGSLLGCLLTDWLSRKGEHSFERHVSRSRLSYIESQMRKRAGWALAIAALMPPPFPFTPIVAGAAAVEYPRKRVLSILGVSRLVRFGVEAVLAIHYGPKVIALAQSSQVEDAIFALIIVAVLASVISVFRWIQKSRRPSPQLVGAR